MEIILQDTGHVSLFLVSEYTPVVNACFPEGCLAIASGSEIAWDVISFRHGFDTGRWYAKPQEKPETFFRRENVQQSKAQGGAEEIYKIWLKGLNMAAYISFQSLQNKYANGENIRTAFNCCSGVIGCLHAMGLSLHGLRGDAGTQYDFSQIGLDF